VLCMTTNDGETFIGPDAEALIARMRDTVWDPPATLEEYIAQVADRVEQTTGHAPRLDPDGFLADLQAVGLARVRPVDA